MFFRFHALFRSPFFLLPLSYIFLQTILLHKWLFLITSACGLVCTYGCIEWPQGRQNLIQLWLYFSSRCAGLQSDRFDRVTSGGAAYHNNHSDGKYEVKSIPQLWLKLSVSQGRAECVETPLCDWRLLIFRDDLERLNHPPIPSWPVRSIRYQPHPVRIWKLSISF